MSLPAQASIDTIAAIATPPGSGGVGIIRISGPRAVETARTLFLPGFASFNDFTPRYLHLGHLIDPARPDDILDEAMVVLMPGPHSFTGEDVVEFHCHGGATVLRAILQAVLRQDVRLAEPGEFSKRAFLNGRIDLTQAEAIAETIAAPSLAALRLAQTRLQGELGRMIESIRTQLETLRRELCVAIDFPEDEVECLAPEALAAQVRETRTAIQKLLAGYERTRPWREGILMVLAGRVNAGKSSLMNALLGWDRAIVTDIPGTTRDYLEEELLLDGLPVRITDTAGLRETGDIVEQEGVQRSRDLASNADIVLLVLDATAEPGPHERELGANVPPERLICVRNKCDLLAVSDSDASQGPTQALCSELAAKGVPVLDISAKQGSGMDALAQAIRSCAAAGQDPAQGELVPNLRQRQGLEHADAELGALLADLAVHTPYDLLSVRLDLACAQLAEITGRIAPEAVLEAVFSQFCIGK